MNRQDIYLSAMRGADGTINVGYLVLFRAGRFVIVVCALLLLGAFIEMYYSETHEFRMGELGDAIGKIIGAFGVLLAALGAYLWGDSKQTPSTTTTITQTTAQPPPPATAKGEEDYDAQSEAAPAAARRRRKA